MERVKLRWHMDKPTKLWIAKTARKELWRVVTPSYDLEDLIQDAYFKWYLISERYANVTERRHIMSLFQRTFLNHIQGLATKRTRDANVNILTDMDLVIHPMDPETATAKTLVNQASPELKKVLALLASDDGCLKLRSRHRAWRPKSERETLNQRLRRLCNIDHQINLADSLIEHFQT